MFTLGNIALIMNFVYTAKVGDRLEIGALSLHVENTVNCTMLVLSLGNGALKRRISYDALRENSWEVLQYELAAFIEHAVVNLPKVLSSIANVCVNHSQKNVRCHVLTAPGDVSVFVLSKEGYVHDDVFDISGKYDAILPIDGLDALDAYLDSKALDSDTVLALMKQHQLNVMNAYDFVSELYFGAVNHGTI